MHRLAAAFLFICPAIPAFAQGAWSDPAGLPVNAGSGSKVIAIDSDTLYFLAGGQPGPNNTILTSNALYRYTISTRTWTLKPFPGQVGAGGGMTNRPGTPYLYIACGNDTAAFYEVNTSNDSVRALTDLPIVPPTTNYPVWSGYRMGYAGTASKVYYLVPVWPQGPPAYTAFYEFNPAPGTGTWTAKANAPLYDGAWQMTWPGQGDFIYAARGGGSVSYQGTSGGTTMWRYQISLNKWISSELDAAILAPLPVGAVGGYITLGPGPVDAIHPQGSLYCIAADPYGWTIYVSPKSLLLSYDIATNEWTVITDTLRFADPNGSIAWAAGDQVYIARGSSTDLVVYSTSSFHYETALDPVPATVWEGGAIAGAGGYLYVVPGSTPAGLVLNVPMYRYSEFDESWSEMAPIPVGEVGTNSYCCNAIASDGASTIYALVGWFNGGTGTKVWKYSIGSDAWTEMAAWTPGYGPGVVLCPVGNDRIFAISRSHEYLNRYPDEHETYSTSLVEFTGGNWETLHPLPAGDRFGGGASLSWPGSGDTIYVMLGGKTQGFRSYSISTGTWTTLKDTPAVVDTNGGALHARKGSNIVYAVNGTTSDFWGYRISTDEWLQLPKSPGTEGAGGGLAWSGVGDYIYMLQGGGSRAFYRYLPGFRPLITLHGQFRMDGTTPLAPGATTHEGRIVVKASVTDDNGYSVRLKAEVRQTGAALTDAATVLGGYGDADQGKGEISMLIPLSIAPATWHWQLQAENIHGVASTWAVFGTTPDDAAEIDMATRPDVAPELGAADQLKPLTRAPIPAGAQIFSAEGVMFQAEVSDDDDDSVRLEVELRRQGEAFQDVATITSPAAESGGTATVILAPEMDRYHWQYRAVDRLGLASAWISWGGNADEAVDFDLQSGGSSGIKSSCSAAPAPSRSPLPWIAAIALLAGALRRRGAAAAVVIAAMVPSVAAAQSGPREWSDAAGSTPVGSVGGVVAVGSDTVYVVGNSGEIGFYRYTISTGTWTQLANLIGEGGSMYLMAYHPGAAAGAGAGTSGFIYGLGVSGTANWYRYDIGNNTWSSNLTPFPTMKGSGACLLGANGKLYALGGTANFYSWPPLNLTGPSGGVTLWEYNPALLNGARYGTWTQRASAPASVGAGARLMYPGTGDTIFVTRGGQAGAPALPNLDVWAYSISLNQWNVKADASAFDPADLPDGVTGSGATATDAAGNFYVVTNDALNGFYRYSPATNQWTIRASKPGQIPCGLACAGDTIVALSGQPGYPRTDLWRYSIAADRFLTTLAMTPQAAGPGGGMIAAKDGDHLFLLAGGGTKNFFRYSISGDSWGAPMADAPDTVSAGAIAYDGNDIIYFVRSGGTEFWSYSISGGGWTVRPPLPAAVVNYNPRTLLHLGGNKLALIVGYEKSVRFCDSDIWSASPDVPSAVELQGGFYPGSGDTMYVQTRDGRTFAYSLSLNRWNSRADGSFLDPDDSLALVTASAAVDHTIYTFGQNGTFWTYSAVHDVWTTKRTPPGALGDGCSVVHPPQGQYLYATGGSGGRFLWRYWLPANEAPSVPFALAQERIDDAGTVAAGATLPETSIVLTARATDPNFDFVSMEVEVQQVGAPFTNASGRFSASLPSGSTLSVVIDGLERGRSYHWQARTIDSEGKPSPTWTSFGGGSADFKIRVNTAPAADAMTQSSLPDGAALGLGQVLLDASDIRFSASPTDAEGDAGRFEVQVALVGTSIGSSPILVGPEVPAGGISEINASLPEGAYYWRGRFRDHYGATGAWIGYGANADGAVDFEFRATSLPDPVAPPPTGGGHGGRGCSASGLPASALLAMAAALLFRRPPSR